MAIKESKTVIKEVIEYWKQELESKKSPSEKSTFITRKTAHLEKLITQLDSDQIKPKDLRKIDKQINRLVILSLKVKEPDLAKKLSQVYETEEAFHDKEYSYIYFDKMTLLSYNKSQLTDEANFGIEENANKISKVSNYINIQNGLDLFSAIYLAASITFLALVSFPPIAIATLAVTLSSLCVVASINERQQISEFKKEQLMGKEILQDISKKLESKQDIADQIEQPPLQRKLSKGNSIIKTDEIQPNGQSISNIANKLSKTETKAQENSRSF